MSARSGRSRAAPGGESRRRWLELRVRCPAAGDRSPLLVEGLLALGARGVEEKRGWYVAYLEEPSDPEDFVARARLMLEETTGLGTIQIETAWQDHEEWAEEWKRGLAPRRVTDRIVVHPSWLEPEDTRDDDVVIVLDPGMAFGTAEHGTTRGCLRLLDLVVEGGQTLLDLGSGSGILSIAAARLGAERVVALEGDPYACEAMRDNVVRNGVVGRVEVVEAWATAQDVARRGPVDGIVANIEAGLLEPLFSGCRRALRPGGWLIISGILAEELDSVLGALAQQGFEVREIDEDGEWRSVLLDAA